MSAPHVGMWLRLDFKSWAGLLSQRLLSTTRTDATLQMAFNSWQGPFNSTMSATHLGDTFRLAFRSLMEGPFGRGRQELFHDWLSRAWGHFSTSRLLKATRKLLQYIGVIMGYPYRGILYRDIVPLSRYRDSGKENGN